MLFVTFAGFLLIYRRLCSADGATWTEAGAAVQQ
jgi:hypothetical protein